MDLPGVLTNLKPLLIGASMTVFVSFAAIVLGTAGGLVLCFASMSPNRVSRYLARVYISFFRGTPLLVQLLLAYYFVPPLLNLDIPPIVAAIAALSMNTSAFQAEIYRGGYLAIPAGNFDAARILGLSVWQTRRRIYIPQMVRLVLPALTNEAINVVKGSSLVSVVAVSELMRASQGVVAVKFNPIEIYLSAAAIYLAINYALSFTSRAGEGYLWRRT